MNKINNQKRQKKTKKVSENRSKMALSHNTKLWLIWVSVFVILHVALVVGIILTWNGIAACVIKCQANCVNNNNNNNPFPNNNPQSRRPHIQRVR